MRYHTSWNNTTIIVSLFTGFLREEKNETNLIRKPWALTRFSIIIACAVQRKRKQSKQQIFENKSVSMKKQQQIENEEKKVRKQDKIIRLWYAKTQSENSIRMYAKCDVQFVRATLCGILLCMIFAYSMQNWKYQRAVVELQPADPLLNTEIVIENKFSINLSVRLDIAMLFPLAHWWCFFYFHISLSGQTLLPCSLHFSKHNVNKSTFVFSLNGIFFVVVWALGFHCALCVFLCSLERFICHTSKWINERCSNWLCVYCAHQEGPLHYRHYTRHAIPHQHKINGLLLVKNS